MPRPARSARLALATLLAASALVGLPAAHGQGATAPQQDWMVHMAAEDGRWRYVPDRLVLVPGGLVQLMVFGDGRFSLTLDDVPGADADIATTTGTVRTAELRAPTEPGEYAFRDKYHPEATGILVVTAPADARADAQEDAEADARRNIVGVVPGGYESRFAPASLVVAPGAEIRFAANGTFGHNLRAVDGAFDAGDLAPGEETTFRAPAAPGTYAFECRFHAEQGMVGTLTVVGTPSAAPSESAASPASGPAETPRGTPLSSWIVLLAITVAALGAALRARWPPA